MSYEYPRFKEWADKNYPAQDYFSAEDRLAEIETRMNGDGRAMPEKLRQSLLIDFQSDYDPAFREMREREEEKRQINEVLTGSPETPKSIPDEIVEAFRKAEFLGIDVEALATTREEVVPPERPILRQSGFGAISSSIKGFLRRIFGR